MRELRWDGCNNVRDLGGLPLAGGETRYRVLVRADDVTQLTASGLEALREYGVSTVVDLRCPTEGVCVEDAVRVPLFRYDDDEFLQAAYACSQQGEFYVLLLERSRALFAEAIEALAAAPRTALFHCAAGRDRTGLVAALVLATVGVGEDAILEDYVSSRSALQARYERLVVAARDDAERERLASEHECGAVRLRTALDHLRAAYGGTEAYLREAGAATDALEALCARLAA